MKKQGELEKAGLGYTLTRLVHREETVLLTVKAPRSHYVLFIDDRGVRLDRIRGGFTTEIEDYLLQDDIIQEIDLLRILAERNLTGRSTIEILLDQGRVPGEQIDALKVRQVEDELLWMLSINKGEYILESADSADAEAKRDQGIPSDSFDIEKLAAAALDRMARFDGISKDFRNEREFFLSDPSRVPATLESLPDGVEKRVLGALDGKRPLVDLIQEMQLPSFKVFGIVNKYIQEGLVRPLKVEELRVGAKAALEAEDLISALSFLRRAFERNRDVPEVVGEIADLFEFAAELPLAAAFQEFLASLFVKRGKIDEAEKAWEKCVSLDPKNLSVSRQLFTRRLESGSRQKALDTGIELVTLAIEENDIPAAAQAVETLLQHGPDSFAIRRKAFELRVLERKVPEAVAEISEMERIAKADSSQEADARYLPQAYQTLSRLDPENTDVQKKLQEFRKVKAKAVASPAKKARKGTLFPKLAIVVLLLGGAAAVVHFYVLPDGFEGLLAPEPVKVQPKEPPKPPPDPHLKQRESLLEVARGFVVAGEFDNAIEKFEEVLKITPESNPTRKDVNKEIDAVKASILRQKEKAFGSDLEGLLNRLAGALKLGRKGSERDVGLAQTKLKKIDEKMKVMEGYCPDSARETFDAARGKVDAGFIELAERSAQILLLKGELEWDKERPDLDMVKRYYKEAAAKNPAGPTARTAGERIDDIEKYI
ncbi:MAG: tetratricopeptide repeat protein, partial [Planctomycetota bacterium]